ncbi:MAG: EAL domain-containing protein [Vicinamibacteria bacterium]|nr:EAL domain-containing protein [Vicinamibacteria bacterium]
MTAGSDLRLLFDHNPHPMWVYDLATLELLDVNDATLEAYGYSREQFLGLRVPDLLAEHERERFAQHVAAHRQVHLRRCGNWRHRTASGRLIDVDVDAHNIAWRGREAAMVMAQDVSAARQAERVQAALFRISETASTVRNVDELCAALQGIVGELTYARNFYIALSDSGPAGLRFAYFSDEHDDRPPEGPLEHGVTAYVLRTGKPLLVTPEVFAALQAAGEVEEVGASSVDWLGVPLGEPGAVFGVLAVQTYDSGHRYTETDRELLTFVSQHVAAGIERKRAAEALVESEARFRVVAETAPCAIFIYQGARFRYVNPATSEITGYSRDELLSMRFWEFVHPDFRDIVKELGLARQQGRELPPRYEFSILRKDGSVAWVDFSAANLSFEGRVASLGTAFDVTERKRAETRVRELAYQDPLTALPNRRLFEDRLKVALSQAQRNHQKVGVLFLDVDRFKPVNDSLGHEVGDRLLRAVADRLTLVLREGDTVARLGGDEFTLLLPALSDAIDAARVAEKLLSAMRRPFRVGEHELFVSGSVGVALSPDDGHDPETLLRNADAAMYRAKERGRDGYELYTPEMNATALDSLALEHDLRLALGRGQLEVHYQPVWDPVAGRVATVEALLRWRHASRGLLDAEVFVPLAEQTGLMPSIGAFVLRSACLDVARWRAAGLPDLTLSVNLSHRELLAPDSAARFLETVSAAGLAPRCLGVEVTRTETLDRSAARAALGALRAAGVTIALDDFGGGASLTDLRRLPVDAIKLDASILASPGDTASEAIARAIVALVRTLGLAVVAEGIETDAQRAFFNACGCDRMQGRLFGAPAPAEETTALLFGNHTPR